AVKSRLHASSPPGETQPELNCLFPSVQDYRFNLLERSIWVLVNRSQHRQAFAACRTGSSFVLHP
ncbi:uncharacterized protein METZ01_LOCUS214586, partial [marine metagenome]